MMQVELRVLSGKQAGTVIPLPVGKFLVGREQDCHLRPNSELVSRHHCAFTLDDFALRIRDLGSTNGTLVNGERIRGTVVLKPGDQVNIGKIDFLVVVDGDAGRESGDTVIGQRDDTVIRSRPKTAEPAAVDDGLDLNDLGAALAALDDDTRVGSGTVSNDPALEEVAAEVAVPVVAANADTQQFPVAAPDPALAAGYPQFAVPPPWMGAPQYPYPQMPYPGYPGMPYAPGYPYPAMPGMPPGAMPPGYGYPMQMAPAPAPVPEPAAPAASAAKAVSSTPEVRLPDPSTTGAKVAAPAPPKPANPDEKAKPAAHIPTAAQSIINNMMQRRPKTE